jgi:hypothetical protein
VSAWDHVRIDRGSSRRLFAVSTAITALAMLPSAWALESLMRSGLPTHAWLWLLPVVLASPPGVWVLAWIERRGVIFFGSRRGWRVTPAVAWTVCGHAASGWVLAGGLVTAGLHAASWGASWAAQARPVGPGLPARDIVIAWAPLAGFFAGMLVFETLVYLGVRRLRFANTAGAGLAAASIETPAPEPGRP